MNSTEQYIEFAEDIKDFIVGSLDRQKPQNDIQYEAVINFACSQYAKMHKIDLVRKKTANLLFYDQYHCVKVDPRSNSVISMIKVDRATVDFYDTILG